LWFISGEVGNEFNGRFVSHAIAECPQSSQEWFRWVPGFLSLGGTWQPENVEITCLANESERSQESRSGKALTPSSAADNSSSPLVPTTTSIPPSMWTEWTNWSSCSYKDCSRTERRSQMRHCKSTTCQGASAKYGDCPKNCSQLRAICCQNMVLRSTHDGVVHGTLIFDQMLFEYPVFRHEDLIDTFLYNSENEWRIGKGLFGSALQYKSISPQSATCPTAVGTTWLARSKIDGRWNPSDVVIGCQRMWSEWGAWSSCVDACLTNRAVQRTRSCATAPEHTNDILFPCEGDESETKTCDCAHLSGDDKACCSVVRVQVNGIMSRSYRKRGAIYSSADNKHIVWSSQMIAWLFVDALKEVYSESDAALRIISLDDECLLPNRERRRKRSPALSNNFQDAEWKIFTDDTNVWRQLNGQNVLTCLEP